MRFVAVKGEGRQAAAVIVRSRDLLVRQRTQLVGALCGHMGAFGLVVPQGAVRVKELIALVTGPGRLVPEAAWPALQVLVSALERLEAEIRGLEAEITRRARKDETARRLMTLPGVGPLIATALVVLAPPGGLPAGEGPCRLAGSHPAPALHRRQAAPGRHRENGRAFAPKASDCRNQQRHPQAAGPRRRPAGQLACAPAAAQAADAGPRGAREQRAVRRPRSEPRRERPGSCGR